LFTSEKRLYTFVCEFTHLDPSETQNRRQNVAILNQALKAMLNEAIFAVAIANENLIPGCLWGVYMRLDPLLNMIADKVCFFT
jgi:hypothetical protein